MSKKEKLMEYIIAEISDEQVFALRMMLEGDKELTDAFNELVKDLRGEEKFESENTDAFIQKVKWYIKLRGLTEKYVYTNLDMVKSNWDRIKKWENDGIHLPTEREVFLKLCPLLKLSYNEASSLLALAGIRLGGSPLDNAIVKCLMQKKYDPREVNELLCKEGLPILYIHCEKRGGL